MFLGIEKFYQKVRKKTNFLPNSPAKKIKLNQIIEKKRNNEIRNLIEDNDIKEIFKFYIENHEKIEDNQGIYKTLFLLQCLKDTDHLEGNVVELGSWKAGNAILMAKFLQQIKSKKKIFACDTFDGIPTEDQFVDSKRGKGMFSDAKIEEISKKIHSFGAEKEIELIKGNFENSLEQLEKEKFSLVFLDCNIYNSAKIAINFSYPRLSPSGIFISHCYGIKKDSNSFWGEGIAVKEYLTSKVEKIVIDSIPFFQKGFKKPKFKNNQPKDNYSSYSEI
tara:strand:- start:867 stop:1697 length:831 start_codon:yes stop_codon:yes gene_type:complete